MCDGGGYGLIWPSLVDTKFRVTRKTQPQGNTRNRLIGILLTRERLVRVRRARICFTHSTTRHPRFYVSHLLPYHPVVFSTRSLVFLLSFLLISALRQAIRPPLSLSHTIPFNPLLGTFFARSPSLLSPLSRSSFSSSTARRILRIPHSRFKLSVTFLLYRVLVRAHHESRGSIRMIAFFSLFSRT